MSPRRRGISDVQQGIIVEHEFAKLVMIGSGGLCELDGPLTDEERRDFEIHEHGSFSSALGVQSKSVTQLFQANPRSARLLRSFFKVRDRNLISDPRFYYFYAYLDLELMRLADPTFLIPSEDFHRLASPEKKDGFWHFMIQASMDPDSHDKWSPYRVNTLNLGQKVLHIVRDIRKLPMASEQPGRLLEVPRVVLVRTAR